MIDRKSHWDQIYSEKSSQEVSWYQGVPELSLELIKNSGIAREDAIIDVGGGASTLVDFLQGNGFTNISVLDISETALACAKKRLGISADDINWHATDITAFAPANKYSLWHDRAVFHFLTSKSDRIKYVNVLKKSLIKNGQAIIAAFALGGPTKCSGLDIVQYDATRISAELGEEFILLEERIEVHITPSNRAQKFMYFRFVINPTNCI